MSAQWFYKLMGDEIGPCTGGELKKQAEIGNIQQDSLIRKGVDGQWVSAWRVKGLFVEETIKKYRTTSSDSHAAKRFKDKKNLEAISAEEKFVEAGEENVIEAESIQKSNVKKPQSIDFDDSQSAENEIKETEIKNNKSFAKSFKSSKKLYGTVSFLLIIISAGSYAYFQGSKASINPIQSFANSNLQSKLNQAVEKDTRNKGIEVSVYYASSFDKSVVVFDLQNISGYNSRLDVFRLFLDFADETQGDDFNAVELAFRGKTKFKISGYYFSKLGKERGFQNPAYTIRTFPENLETPSGLNAYPEWTGGMLGVLGKQMEDFNDFHDKWYMNELNGY